jgi:hypothetical protein
MDCVHYWEVGPWGGGGRRQVLLPRAPHTLGTPLHTAHEHGVELERRISAVRERNIGINKRLKASQFKR